MHPRHPGSPSFFPLAAALAVALLFLSCIHEEGEEGGLGQDFVPGGKAISCGYWTAYAEDTSGYWVLRIEGVGDGDEEGRDTLPIGGEPPPAKRAEASLYRLDRKGAMTQLFCNDVATDIVIVDSLTGVSGSVHVRKFDRNPEPFFIRFWLDLEVRDARFEREDGSEARIGSLRLDSLYSGWFPG